MKEMAKGVSKRRTSPALVIRPLVNQAKLDVQYNQDLTNSLESGVVYEGGNVYVVNLIASEY